MFRKWFVVITVMAFILIQESHPIDAQGRLDSFGQQALNHINTHRSTYGCSPLTHAQEYQSSAELWAIEAPHYTQLKVDIRNR